MRFSVFGLALCLMACGTSETEMTPAAPDVPIAQAPISRCMNMGSALEAPREGEWGYTVRRDDLARVKEAGFDTVRLPVRWSAHTAENPPYEIDQDLLARVDEVRGWTEEVDLNVIVNVHHYDALNEAPDEHEPRLEAIWDQLASHYAGAPSSLIFETINEPHTKMDTARTDALNKRVLARIREDHPERWVILGTAFWGNLSALEESRPGYDPNVMLTYHEYSPFDFTHQGAPWADTNAKDVRWGTRKDISEMISELDKVVEVQERTRMPVFVGEFGVYEGVPTEHRARWIRTLREGFEARGLAWCHWDFAGSLKTYDTEREAWLPEVKAALLD